MGIERFLEVGYRLTSDGRFELEVCLPGELESSIRDEDRNNQE